MIFAKPWIVPIYGLCVILLVGITEWKHIIRRWQYFIQSFIIIVPFKHILFIEANLLFNITQAYRVIVVFRASLYNALTKINGLVYFIFSKKIISFYFPKLLRESFQWDFICLDSTFQCDLILLMRFYKQIILFLYSNVLLQKPFIFVFLICKLLLQILIFFLLFFFFCMMAITIFKSDQSLSYLI